MRIPVRALSLVLLVMSAQAFAAPGPLAQARAAMAAASFEKAITIAEKALRTVKDAKLRGQLELVRAESSFAMRKPAPMKEALERALRADPLAALDVDSANPQLVEELARLRKSLAGKVVIGGTFAPGAAPQIILDDVKLGLAPVNMLADVGRHKVRIVWPAGDIQEEDVVVRAETDVSLVLSRAAPSVVVPQASPEPERKAETAPPPEPPPSRAKASEDEASSERAPTAAVSSSTSSGIGWPVIALGAGAVGVLAGIICLGVAGAQFQALTGGNGVSTLELDHDGVVAYVSRGRAIQNTGIVLTVLGVIAAAAGGAGLLLGGDDGPRVSLLFGPGGAAFAVTGTLP